MHDLTIIVWSLNRLVGYALNQQVGKSAEQRQLNRYYLSILPWISCGSVASKFKSPFDIELVILLPDKHTDDDIIAVVLLCCCCCCFCFWRLLIEQRFMLNPFRWKCNWNFESYSCWVTGMEVNCDKSNEDDGFEKWQYFFRVIFLRQEESMVFGIEFSEDWRMSRSDRVGGRRRR